MSIANELCSDVATAVLARQDDQEQTDAHAMTRILLEVHATLRRLTREDRRNNLRRPDSAAMPIISPKGATSGGH